jgi:hypothetical protein
MLKFSNGCLKKKTKKNKTRLGGFENEENTSVSDFFARRQLVCVFGVALMHITHVVFGFAFKFAVSVSTFFLSFHLAVIIVFLSTRPQD